MRGIVSYSRHATLIALACLVVHPAHAKNAGVGPYDPPIDPANFTSVIDNPYLPLSPGVTYHYSSLTPDGVETTETTVTADTKSILDVMTVVVHDQALLDGSLVEDTFDWYAQDLDGNVWYFGEDTRQYEGGVLVGTEGSWEAGVDGAKPGIVMEAAPAKGDAYRQEYLAGIAEDMARVVALGESVSVPYGAFDDCIETVEWSPLEHGVREHKFYCPSVGLVRETGKNHELNELLDVSGP